MNKMNKFYFLPLGPNVASSAGGQALLAISTSNHRAGLPAYGESNKQGTAESSHKLNILNAHPRYYRS
jgi:hypothetical protein